MPATANERTRTHLFLTNQPDEPQLLPDSLLEIHRIELQGPIRVVLRLDHRHRSLLLLQIPRFALLLERQRRHQPLAQRAEVNVLHPERVLR